jgi:hypothetical protein
MKTLIKEIYDFLVESGHPDTSETNHLARDIAERIESKFFVSIKRSINDQVADLAKEICDSWNTELSIKRGITPSPQLTKLINARLSSFSVEELKMSALGRLRYIRQSPWHAEKKNRHHAINPTIQFRSDELTRRWMDYYLDETGDEPQVITKQIEAKIDERFFE